MFGGVFIWEKVWFKNSLSQSGGEGTGRVQVRVEKQALKAKDPKCRPENVREKWRSSPLLFLLTPPMKIEKTECSETLAYKIQMPENYPKERLQHSEHGKSLKSRICLTHYLLRMTCDKRCFTAIAV